MRIEYNIPDHYKGDTFDALEFTILDDDGLTPIDLTDATIKSQFRRKSKSGKLTKELNVADGITVTDALNGVIELDAFILDWDANTYYYDIKFTFIDGKVVTYRYGIIKMIQNITV